ncbi:hypothetical protein IQ07DRAFT_595759 [Pyrenochaeta sp. DS3sAY3a]|nr:hypothetical protein IQ07DRAFT_595759 [Pyrenochaeta sp. DS3sAY3a]
MPLPCSYRTVVFTEIPSPYNILMILYILKASPHTKLAIVLRCRAVDLSVSRDRDSFAPLYDILSLQELAFPDSTDQSRWIRQVPKESRHEFLIQDSDTSDPEVQRDSFLYMKLSVLRIVRLLEDCGCKHSCYTLFWDEESLLRPMHPHMRHAAHPHDFKYGFSSDEMLQYEESLTSSGQVLRAKLRAVCLRYIQRQIAELQLSPNDLLHSFSDLLRANKDIENVDLVVGGPFTEALKYLRYTATPKSIVATGERLGLSADADSAEAFLKLAQRGPQNFKLIAPEFGLARTSSCPFQFNLERHALGKHTSLYRSLQEYTAEMQRAGKLCHGAINLITAVAALGPHLLQWKTARVQLKQDRKTGDVKLIESLSLPWRKPNIEIAILEDEATQNSLVAKLCQTVC